MELTKETADAFRSIGSYCLGRELKGDNVHETMCFMKKRGQVYLGTNSQYFLDGSIVLVNMKAFLIGTDNVVYLMEFGHAARDR